MQRINVREVEKQQLKQRGRQMLMYGDKTVMQRTSGPGA